MNFVRTDVHAIVHCAQKVWTALIELHSAAINRDAARQQLYRQSRSAIIGRSRIEIDLSRGRLRRISTGVVVGQVGLVDVEFTVAAGRAVCPREAIGENRVYDICGPGAKDAAASAAVLVERAIGERYRPVVVNPATGIC